jgi:hypothetical protein
MKLITILYTFAVDVRNVGYLNFTVKPLYVAITDFVLL